MKIKNILVLAGGDSTRFWPFSNKSYFRFLGKTLLEHLINQVQNYAEQVSIVVNQSDNQLINQLNLTEVNIIEQKKEYSGQAGAILSAKNQVEGNVLILNADDIFNYSIIKNILKSAEEKNSEILLTGLKVKNYFPGGYFKFENNKIIRIIEKPGAENVPSDTVRLVVDFFKDFDKLTKTLENTKTDEDNLYEEAINNLLKQNIKTDYIFYDSYWYPLKYPWHLLPVMKFFLSKLNTDIKLGKNVKIAKTAKIVGPCFIDDNSVIGDFALVRESNIGKGCVIGGYSEITRSFLGDNVMLHRNYVGDSVLDENVMMGAEATTANFRFDGKAVNSNKINTGLIKLGAMIGSNSKIGVNSTLLPGIKIGTKTFIAPGYTIAEDVEDKIFIFHKKKVKNKHFK